MVRGRKQKKIIPDYYSPAWFKHLKRNRHYNTGIILAIMAHLGIPKKGYLDLGCGAGTMMKVVRKIGVKHTAGVELSSAVYTAAPKWLKITIADLTQPLTIPGMFDLVTCISVGEYIHYSGLKQFMANVVNSTSRWLVFSASLPGFNPEQTLSARWPSLWLADFEHLGLTFDKVRTDQIKETLKWTSGPLQQISQGLLVFRRDR